MAAEARICTTGGKAAADNFSAIVDVVRFHQFQSCSWRNRRVQVENCAINPDHCATHGAIAGERLSNDLSTGVDGIRETVTIAVKSSKVGDLSVLPEKRTRPPCWKRGLKPLVLPPPPSSAAIDSENSPKPSGNPGVPAAGRSRQGRIEPTHQSRKMKSGRESLQKSLQCAFWGNSRE